MVGNLSCGQESKKKLNTTYKPKQYKERPYYTVQVAKGGCNIELICNDAPLYKVFRKGGFSANIPLNGNIEKSGEQSLTLKVYPDEGSNVLNDLSYVSLDFRLFQDVDDPAGEYTSILKYELPKVVIENQLPFFEINIPFEAEVPYDISYLLENAQVLEDQKGIEEAILKEYQRAHRAMTEKDGNWFKQKFLYAEIAAANAFYLSEEKYNEIIRGYDDYFEEGQEVKPLQDYTLKFYAKGKIAILESNKDKGPALRYTTKKGSEVKIGFPLIKLKGSDEFISP